MDSVTRVPFGVRTERTAHAVSTPVVRRDQHRQASVTPDGQVWALSAVVGTETATKQ